jgi:methylamine dehydrogenase heavy chain
MSSSFTRLAALAGAAAAAAMSSAHAELPVEPIPAVERLPAIHPQTFVYVVDPNFYGIESGKVVVVDVGAEVKHHRGALGAAQFGVFAAARTRPELYVVETFYSRGQRGERTDVLTIYDKATLDVVGEVVLPGAKRAQMLTERGVFQLSADGRYAYVFNFTPASSVTVVDLQHRRIAADIDLPGCWHAFALKAGGFASLCGNGAVASTKLDAQGHLASQTISEPFNDIDADPMFTRPAVINGIAYFPTYGGRVQPIDLNGDVAVPGEAWDIPQPAADAARYLPSGWQLSAYDDAGRLYFLMRKTENIDDHDTGSDEVWVFDPVAKTIVNRLKLRSPSQIIEVTGGEDPYLVAVNPDMSLDVLKASSGEFVRRIGGQIAITPFAAIANK